MRQQSASLQKPHSKFKPSTVLQMSRGIGRRVLFASLLANAPLSAQPPVAQETVPDGPLNVPATVAISFSVAGILAFMIRKKSFSEPPSEVTHF